MRESNTARLARDLEELGEARVPLDSRPQYRTSHPYSILNGAAKKLGLRNTVDVVIRREGDEMVARVKRDG